MNTRCGLLLISALFVAGSVAAQVHSDDVSKSGSKTVRGNGIYSALQEPVPPVVLHHAIFGRPVQISDARPVRTDNLDTAFDVSTVLVYASSGVVIGKDHRAIRVDPGDAVSIGDFIIGGVVENRGNSSLRLFLNGGGDIRLKAGERLYVGTEARILEPQGSQGGVAVGDDWTEPILHVDANGRAVLASGGSPRLAPPTHCAQCNCECSGNHCSCPITIAASINTDCGDSNGTTCECGTNPECVGRTKGCILTFVPCAQ